MKEKLPELRVKKRSRMPTRKELSQMTVRDMLRHKAHHDPNILNDINRACVFVWRTLGAKTLKDVENSKTPITTIQRAISYIKKNG